MPSSVSANVGPVGISCIGIRRKDENYFYRIVTGPPSTCPRPVSSFIHTCSVCVLGGLINPCVSLEIRIQLIERMLYCNICFISTYVHIVETEQQVGYSAILQMLSVYAAQGQRDKEICH